MPFDALCNKLREEVFNPENYRHVGSRNFFVRDDGVYDNSEEDAEVVNLRTSISKPVGETSRAELKLGWLGGMRRDYLVQAPTNYSELMRNNCVLRRNVDSRLEESQKALSGK